MNHPITVAAIQMISTDNVAGNIDAAGRLISDAARRGASLVALPENFAVLDGGPLRQYGEVQGGEDAPLQRFLADSAREHGIFLVGGTVPLITRPEDADGNVEPVGQGRVRSASLVYGPDGRLLGRYDKMHLFDVEVDDRQSRYRESASFEPGGEVVVVDTPLARLGLSICYDLRFPELYRRLRDREAELVTVPSAFTRVTGQAHWESLLRARAIENQVYVVAPDQGGVHNASRETYGHSMIIDPWGEVLAVHESGEGVALATIDPDRLNELRRRMPVISHRRLG